MLSAMKRLWRGWKKLAHGIITVQNSLLLGVVFFAGIGPTAILARITRRKLLDRRSLSEGEQPDSHWIAVQPQVDDLNTAQRPF